MIFLPKWLVGPCPPVQEIFRLQVLDSGRTWCFTHMWAAVTQLALEPALTMRAFLSEPWTLMGKIGLAKSLSWMVTIMVMIATLKEASAPPRLSRPSIMVWH